MHVNEIDWFAENGRENLYYIVLMLNSPLKIFVMLRHLQNKLPQVARWIPNWTHRQTVALMG